MWTTVSVFRADVQVAAPAVDGLDTLWKQPMISAVAATGRGNGRDHRGNRRG